MAGKSKFEYWISTEGLIKIEGWARDGYTDEEIAKSIGIHRDTLYVWKNKYKAIADTLKKGKDVVDRKVENSLLKRALGYRYEEVTKEISIDEDTGESKLVITKVVTKEVTPDVTAQIFWLKNRKPEQWKNDPHKTELDREILELRKKELESKVW